MKTVIFIILFFAFYIVTNCNADNRESHLLLLKNNKFVVGVSLRLGGRIMLYRPIDGANVLLSNKDHWNEEEKKIPKLSPNSGFKQYLGHTVWIGPQAEWWSDQNFNLDRKQRNAVWPPDPFPIFGKFKILKQQKNYLKIQGPKSPVSGLQLTKEITLFSDGKLEMTVSAENIRKRAVKGNIWSNTRLPGNAKTYVPIIYSAPFKTELSTWDPQLKILMNYDIRNGFFFFKNSAAIPPGKNAMENKAFINPTEGTIAAFNGSILFLKQTKLIPRDKIHKTQAFVEIYNLISTEPSNSITELEFQGEYKTLEPGEKMSMKETWSIIEYTGKNSPEGHIRFLKKLKIKN
jgi:hypothetical protein